jgi:hypothetical protein
MVQKVNIHLILVSLIRNMEFNFISYLIKPTLTVCIIQVCL